jgi:hypothetical protein
MERRSKQIEILAELKELRAQFKRARMPKATNGDRKKKETERKNDKWAAKLQSTKRNEQN